MRAVHERDGYPTYWPGDPERFAAGDDTLAAWVAELHGELVGQAVLTAVDPDHAWAPWLQETGGDVSRIAVLGRFFVAPPARGSGAGGMLFAAAEDGARARGLWPVLDVAVHNTRAMAMYERRGWRRVGEATLTLRDPPGAQLSMLLYVAPPA